MTQKLDIRSNHCVQVKTIAKTKIYNHDLPPLLMQNSYSKFIFAIKTLIFDRFSKFLQALLRQIETQMLNKIFSCPPAIENSRQKFILPYGVVVIQWITSCHK